MSTVEPPTLISPCSIDRHSASLIVTITIRRAIRIPVSPRVAVVSETVGVIINPRCWRSKSGAVFVVTSRRDRVNKDSINPLGPSGRVRTDGPKSHLPLDRTRCRSVPSHSRHINSAINCTSHSRKGVQCGWVIELAPAHRRPDGRGCKGRR